MSVLAWGGTLILALVLRVGFLSAQVVEGDEVQAIYVGRSHFAGEIVTRFFPADPSLPIALWCRLLLTTVGLEEWGLRLPFALAGFALVALFARVSRTWLALPERLLLTALLATSPVLVFWSRMARPYVFVCLLGCLAALSLVRLRSGARPGWFALAVVGQTGMLLFSPTALPTVLGLALGALILGRTDGSARWRAALPSVAGLGLAALLLSPALPSLLDVAGGKLGQSEGVTPETYVETARLAFGFQVGATGDLLAALLAVLALAGWVRLLLRDRALALGALAVLVVPLVAYSLVPVLLIERGVVFARYQSLHVPWLLGFLVYAVGGVRAACSQRSRVLHATATLATPLLVGLHVLLGPLPAGLPPRHPFGLGRSSLTLPPSALFAVSLPPFYGRVERDAVLVEWPSDSTLVPLQLAYQRIHGRRTIRWADCGSLPRGDVRAALRTLVMVERPPLDRVPGGAYLVFHKRPRGEDRAFRNRSKSPGSRGNSSRRARLVERLHRLCEQDCGPRVFEDRWILAYRAP